jgi:hypothetical protein
MTEKDSGYAEFFSSSAYAPNDKTKRKPRFCLTLISNGRIFSPLFTNYFPIPIASELLSYNAAAPNILAPQAFTGLRFGPIMG